jgi:hypothetical protein
VGGFWLFVLTFLRVLWFWVVFNFGMVLWVFNVASVRVWATFTCPCRVWSGYAKYAMLLSSSGLPILWVAMATA